MSRKICKLLGLAAIMIFISSVTLIAQETPDIVTGIKQIHADSNTATIQWTRQPYEEYYYQIRVSSSPTNWDDAEYYKTLDNRGKIPNLYAGNDYYVYVRAYILDEENDERIYGGWSDRLKISTSPDAEYPLYIDGLTSKSVSVRWNSVWVANKYIIYYGGSTDNLQVIGTTKNPYYKLDNRYPLESGCIAVMAVRDSGSYVARSKYYYYKYFETMPEKVYALKVRDTFQKSSRIRVSWESVSELSGYEIQVYKYNSKKIYKTYNVNSLSAYLSGIKSGMTYKIRIRGYKNVDNKKYYTGWSGYTYAMQQPKVKFKSLKGKLSIKWKKTKGATSYSIYFSKTKNGIYKKIKTTKKAKAVIKKYNGKKLKKHKKYYFYIVANKKIGKKTIKSNAEYYYYFKLI